MMDDLIKLVTIAVIGGAIGYCIPPIAGWIMCKIAEKHSR